MKENKISSDEWSWLIYGRRISLTWSELQIPELMKNYFKIFLFNQSKNKSPATLENQEIFFIKKFGKSLDLIENSTPITIADWITIIDDLISGGYANNMYYSIRSFVKFSQSREIDIPYDEILNYLLSFKGSFNNLPYQKIFLNQHHVDYEYLRIIREYTIWNKSESHSILTKKLIVLLSLEIAPRASQLYLLDSDRIIKHSTDYYSLSLPLVKKKLTRNNEYRNRRISKHLGELIDEVLFRNRTILNQKKSVPLIISSKHGSRISARGISQNVASVMMSLGLKKVINLTKLRHAFAQELAEQGASAEIIAELLGHNSTVPAKAYIASTPSIAEIKTKSLGKNNNYLKIRDWILTGELIDDPGDKSDPKSVSGLVGNQYIGGIGQCGLSAPSSCSKNPIYSCYECPKFNPYKSNIHSKVKLGMQNQIQQFLDVAERNGGVLNNRTLPQLEETINAISIVIKNISNE